MVTLSSLGTISTIIGGAITTIVGVRRITQRSERLRRRILDDLELRDRLPEGSDGRVSLETHVDESVRALVHLQSRQMSVRTDPYLVIWAFIFAGLAAAAGSWAWRNDPAQWVEVLLWAIVAFLVLLIALAIKVARDPEKESDPG